MSGPFLDVLSEYFDSGSGSKSGMGEAPARPPMLVEFCQAVERGRGGLAERQLSARAEEFARGALRRLTTLCAAYDGDGFEQRAAAAYADPAAFRGEAELALALDRAPDHAQTIVEMAAYVDAAAVPESDSPVQLHELAIDRRLVAERLSASIAFLAPHQVDEVAGNFAVFRRRYVDAYLAHHGTHQTFAQTAARDLTEAESALVALELLDGIPELGAAAGGELRALLDGVGARLHACRTTSSRLRQQLEAGPLCDECGLTLSDGLPEGDLRRLDDRLQEALRAKRRRLASVMASRAADDTHHPTFDRFLRAVQAADVGPLIEVIDDQTVALIRELLEGDA